MTSPHHEFPDRIPHEFHPHLRRFARQDALAAAHTPSEDLIRNFFDQFLRAFAEKHALTSEEFTEFSDQIADVCEKGMFLARKHDYAQAGRPLDTKAQHLPPLSESE